MFWRRRGSNGALVTVVQYRSLRAQALGMAVGVHRSRSEQRVDLEAVGAWCTHRLDEVCREHRPRLGVPWIAPDVVDELAAVCSALGEVLRTQSSDLVVEAAAWRVRDQIARAMAAVQFPDTGPGNGFVIPAIQIPLSARAEQTARWTAAADAEGFTTVGRWASDVLAGMGGAGWENRPQSVSIRRATSLCEQAQRSLKPLVGVGPDVSAAYRLSGLARSSMKTLK